MATIQGEVGGVVFDGFSGVSVGEMCCCIEGFDPEGVWKASLEQEGTYYVVR